MPKDEYVAVLGRGAAAWNAWRAEHDEVPDLSRAALRGLDLTGFDLTRADLRSADLRGTNLCDANLSGARLEGANFFLTGRLQSRLSVLWTPIVPGAPAGHEVAKAEPRKWF
jgi:Pentapeptide repeats (8 copies)